ncbi:indole-3-glycerol phosphate synthase-domain-containing protein [Zychaea mexicana]|uniref:indole-3-glycerol phosphate synthase-domain-containing protein n=1 Tax=Zychaea mexicana TaxID=64656 RepID=UPI0022FE5C0E|nr:indole-3-glycerol phosphate synthase-domain-containing protein [Zychaea mexicana]KAI9496155.1 indole-3-glycerol phosphate synthase-domain-containing protein [Zychaea mexicana]
MATLLIDNYDSFTYNVYQYLSALGADVVVHRNDKITIPEIEALNPRNIVISPGPGHPSQDAGVSRQVISHFAGKVPIFGICMGEQCIFEVFGGTVSYAGDILHGKTSTIKHDGRSIFKNVPQDNQVTRYHSLAGMPTTLPDVLEVTATTDNGVIMGVRHVEYTIEGVQFHPESILCDHGRTMLANFLNLRGGYWHENPAAGVLPKKQKEKPQQAEKQEQQQQQQQTNGPASTPTPSPTPNGVSSVLTRIYAQRQQDVQNAKEVPGQSQEDLEKQLALHIAPPLKDFPARVRQTPLALMAEVKRASPSKGEIDIKANAAEQALKYALAGASVISVLTEPKWFRGSLSDMRQVRQALDHLPNRPCILRKDFILDRYQILEARLYGADTVLLIVAMLSDETLHDLYNYAKGLGMEPLVEVNNAEEMARANALGAQAIGVNNRNLHSFDVDMETTTRLAKMVPQDTILCALSGISSRADVEPMVAQGVRAILVGESLMRAWNLKEFVAELLGFEKHDPAAEPPAPPSTLVKICGISSVEAAVEAAKAGADLIGLIFAPKSKRYVGVEKAREIVNAVRALDNSPEQEQEITSKNTNNNTSTDWFELHKQLLEKRPRKPLVVGVFVNESVEEMTRIATAVGLDLIQLHGTESAELARFLPVPAIKAFHMDSSSFDVGQLPHITYPGNYHYVLLDAKVSGLPSDQQGGRGVKFDWSIAQQVVSHKRAGYPDSTSFPVILAGGLDVSNVSEAIHQVSPWAVDVSSGVETDGVKDLEKIREFVRRAKAAHQ